MPPEFLHEHKDFSALIRIIADEKNIEPGLVEKDYWIMHVLYGLKKQKFHFELKGGTSLSKGYKIIHRFSEDIDIHIKPPEEFDINENPKNNNKNNVSKRKAFYDWLANEIEIPGVISIERDTLFDDEYYRSGGIRLQYENKANKVDGMKEGILLEAGFDNVTPNTGLNISSWAYDKAQELSTNIIDNTAVDILCYHPGYTLVEKLQTIATKFRNDQSNKGEITVNFMRQYYDVYCLLENSDVLNFVGTQEYLAHKEKRFPKPDLEIPIRENEAFLLSKPEVRNVYAARYKATAALYYQGQPAFDELIERIALHIDKL